ncbi:transposase [Streptomyces lavendulocolor]|uniref:Transposase n=2 Tax=Streptomyces lavendulocolor TaxID=67316 RepID=A0ABV2WBT4_9ACTN
MEDLNMPEDYSPAIFAEFLTRTLASIPRSDQRRWGELYVRGLLSVDGKKTMRALATHAGGGVEQSLYQFITKSPWDCVPVRREMARHLHRHTEPRAWVVRPLVITKVGQHSVGVERQFVAQLGRIVNCQQGMGLWLASDQLSSPVDWWLALPECWTDEPEMRRRASIPEHVGSCPPEQCAIGSVARMTEEWNMPARPVVMDLRDTAPFPLCAELMDRQVPFVVRVDPAKSHTLVESLRPADRAPGTASAAGPDAGLTGALSRNRMPVEWFDHRTGAVRATSVGSTRVRLRSPGGGRDGRQDLVLLGAWGAPGRRAPSEYWLSNMSRPRLGTVYRTAMLSRRVERDQAEVSDRLGLRDFEGRSFRGWHHHMTMVSLAHAITVLSRADRGPVPEPSVPRSAKVSAA